MSILRFLLFGVVSGAVQVLCHYYIWRRLVHDTGIGQPWRRRLTWLIVVLAASVPLTLWSSRLIDPSIGQVAGWPALIWMGLGVLLTLGLLFHDLIRGVMRGAAALTRRRRATDPSAADFDPSRRQFFSRVAGGAVAAAATGTAVHGIDLALRDIKLEEVPVTLDKLPPALDGFRIVQVSDIHVGYTVGRRFVAGIVARINEARPDLVAITGDLVDGPAADLAHTIAPLADIAAPHGVYFVTGNHEYYAGVEPWLVALQALGVRVLRNERVTISRDGAQFDLAGIDDHDATRFGGGHGANLAKALDGRAPDREVVLLAHQPRQVRGARFADVGLQLSGHTHGGQIWPWHYLASLQQGGLLAGLSRHDRTQLYVSRGTGYWGPPLRVCAPPEITRIVLRAPAALG